VAEAIKFGFVIERSQGLEDEALAAISPTTAILITADCAAVVERVARRIHAASDRAALPFVQIAAAALPLDPAALVETCAALLDAACGGTALLTDVEHTPAIVQDRLIDTLTALQATRERRCGVRLIAGTTTALYERVAAGKFSERLFYRLNSIHVRATNFEGDGSQVWEPLHSVTTAI
jgi:two-component system response regulator GlrR